MRSACKALLLLACACGNLSNEDVAFLEAIPQKQLLHVEVPQGSAAQTLCAIGSADVYASAKTIGQGLNGGVDAILSLVDAIRAVTPTSRDDDSRTWGPFDDKDHPGVKIQVVMVRELDATYTPWRWIYTICMAVNVYFLLFVLITQLFLKVPVLHALAPNAPDNPEPPFAIAQVILLGIFVWLIWKLVKNFRGAATA